VVAIESGHLFAHTPISKSAEQRRRAAHSGTGYEKSSDAYAVRLADPLDKLETLFDILFLAAAGRGGRSRPDRGATQQGRKE